MTTTTTTPPAVTNAAACVLSRLAQPARPLRIVQAHNAVAARVAASAQDAHGLGFDGLWCSSLADSVCRGVADRELVDHGSRLESLSWLVPVTPLPVWYDADSGGWPEQVALLTRRLGRLNVAAICVEDKVGPKRNSMSAAASSQPAAPLDLLIDRIRAARSVRGARPLVVSRIETLIRGDDPDDAVRRAQASVEAGADAVLLHAGQGQAAALLALVSSCRERGLTTPIVVVPTAFPDVPASDFVSAGVDVVVHANQMLRSAAAAMTRCAQCLLDGELPPALAVADLLGLAEPEAES